MEKNTLTEIKKGQTGTGLLIEHEGYISSDCGDNKKSKAGNRIFRAFSASFKSSP